MKGAKLRARKNTRRQVSLRASKAGISVGAAVLYALYGGRALAAPEQAIDSAGDQNELTEVTVTARRRTENIQDVPLSITALSAETIQENNIQSMESLAQLSPSLSFVSTQDRDNPEVTIRGQGPSPGAGPAVVFYLDEVPMPQNQSTGAAVGGPGFFFDLENIQVLKGPQGTLFGRNTTGGAVLIQTARPKDDFEGDIQVGYGNYNDRELDAMLNTPIIDHTLLARFAISAQQRDGFTEQVGEPGRNLDNVDRLSGRATITFKPTDGIQNDFIYSFANLKSNGTSALISAVNPGLAIASGYPQLIGYLAQQQALGPRVELPTDQLLFNQRTFWSATDIFRLDIEPNVTFRNIAGYTYFHYSLGVDWDDTPLPLFQFAQGQPYPLHFNTYTEEPQLQGTALNGNLTWTAGAFYLDSPAGSLDASTTAILGSPSSLLYRLESHSEALYTQETYDMSSLLQGLKVTGGYRYTWDHVYAYEKSVLPGTNECLSGPLTQCTTQGSANFSSPTWNFDVDYHFTRDTMAYFAAKRGYRDGGFDTNSSAATAVAAFGPEHLTDYELGVKSEWHLGDMRARTDFDVYRDYYEGIQVAVNTVEDGTIVQLTENGANALIQGAEFDVSFFPTDTFQFGATGSYINFNYTSSSSGAQLSQAHEFPRWKYSLNARYSLPLQATLGTISAYGNWGWQAHGYIGPYGDPVAQQGAYGIFNGGADWKNIGGGPVDVSFFINNAFNKTYAISDASFYTFFGSSSLTYGLPRMYGVRLNYRFGGGAK
jgi:iron complex outermembrane receptor protein